MGLSWRLIGVLGGAAALLLGGLIAADRLFPPDLARFRDRSTIVTDAGGELLRAFETADGKWRLRTAPGDVDPRYLAMLKSYEDRRFDRHDGVDWAALLRAAASDAMALRAVSGGSTLTMQSARLLMPHQRSLGGKTVEMLRALQLERRLAKDDILETYLTLAPFGGNVEGVRAAAMIYFGKEPRHLTVAQAALLVALPQSPERRRPDLHPDVARQARDKILRRLQESGTISAAELADALSEPVPTQRLALPFLAPHLAGELAEGARGSAIRTTLDADLQRRIEAMLRRERLEDGAAIAALVVENAGRQVRAYVGGVDFSSAAGQVDLVRATRSPGSTLKPFVYGMAFDDGFVHPETRILDAPIRLGDYAPQNFDRSYQGIVTVREALQMSLNIPAVAILDRVGPGRLVDMLDRGGVHLAFPSRVTSPSLPVVLGGVGTSLHDLVMLYAGLADGGRMKPLRVQSDGRRRRVLPHADARGVMVSDPDPARQRRSRRLCLGRRRRAADRLQDRDVLRVSRRLGDRLFRRLDGRHLGRAAGRRAAAGLLRAEFSGAGTLPRLRAAARRQAAAIAAAGRGHRRLEPRRLAGLAARLPRRPGSTARGTIGAAAHPVPAGGRDPRPRLRQRRLPADCPAGRGRARISALDRRRRTPGPGGVRPAGRLDAGRARLRPSLGHRRRRGERQPRNPAARCLKRASLRAALREKAW